MGKKSNQQTTTDPNDKFLAPLSREDTVLWASVGIFLATALFIAVFLTGRTERQLRRKIRKHLEEPAE